MTKTNLTLNERIIEAYRVSDWALAERLEHEWRNARLNLPRDYPNSSSQIIQRLSGKYRSKTLETATYISPSDTRFG